MRVPFRKMHGLGNDFVVIDRRALAWTPEPAALRHLADRRYGVGCDQVLLLETPAAPAAQARYAIYNADGSQAEHCGNGVRCVATYLHERGESRDGRVLVEIGDAIYALDIGVNGEVRVDMGRPRFAPADIPLAVPAEARDYPLDHAGQHWRFGAVSMGNPHAVFAVADVGDAPVATLGPLLQDSPLFPRRVNVGFLEVRDPGRARLRVYERGVGETQACGTGACAAVAVGRRWGTLGPRVDIELRGGHLLIEWDGEAEHALYMTGPTTYVFEGIIDL